MIGVEVGLMIITFSGILFRFLGIGYGIAISIIPSVSLGLMFSFLIIGYPIVLRAGDTENIVEWDWNIL